MASEGLGTIGRPFRCPLLPLYQIEMADRKWVWKSITPSINQVPNQVQQHISWKIVKTEIKYLF